MILFEQLNSQLESSLKVLEEAKKQNTIFEQTIQKVAREATEENQKQIQELQSITKKALKLAMEGKNEEAQELIKTFQDACQNSK